MPKSLLQTKFSFRILAQIVVGYTLRVAEISQFQQLRSPERGNRCLLSPPSGDGSYTGYNSFHAAQSRIARSSACTFLDEYSAYKNGLFDARLTGLR